MIGPY